MCCTESCSQAEVISLVSSTHKREVNKNVNEYLVQLIIGSYRLYREESNALQPRTEPRHLPTQ